MRDVRRGLWLVAAGLWLLVGVTYVHADEPGDVRGGYFEYSWSQGKFIWEPFLKIDVPTTDGEDGVMQVWGFRNWNLEPPKKDGKTYPVNIPEERFIACDRKAHLVVIQHPSDPDRKVEKWITPPCEAMWK